MEIGLSIEDMDKVDICQIEDILTEKGNDDYDFPVLATQEDFDKF